MAANIDRFKKDFDRLIREGQMLDFSMVKKVDEEKFLRQAQKQLGKDKVDAFIKTLPVFNEAYEPWYSETLALLRQLLPDRVHNFVSLYEKPKNRKSIEYGNYVIQDYLQGMTVTFAGSVKVDTSAAVPQFRQQLAIVKAAKVRFESSLFEIRQVLQADLFDTELSAARELLKSRFLRAAGALAGVVLEKHLFQVCQDHAIQIAKKNPGIGDLNELLKASGVIDVPQWRHISMLADIRNLCAHNKAKDPSEAQVGDLIDGTDKILKTVS